MVARELGFLSFGKVLLECLDGGVDGLHGRGEVHLACTLEKVVLQVEVTVVGTLGIVFRLANLFCVADNERESSHGHQAFLGRCHAEIDVVFLHVEGNHAERRGGVGHEDGTMLMCQSTYLADGVEDACACLVMGGIDDVDVGVFVQRLLHIVQVRTLIHR